MKDQLSDMLTRIKNGQKSGLFKIKLFKPTSNLCLEILNILYNEGYIRGYTIKANRPLEVEVFLKYTLTGTPVITKINRISKPSRRIYLSVKSLWNINGGSGIFILSTPKGLMTDKEAKFLNQGGEILCSIL